MWYFRDLIPQQLRHGSASIVVLRRSTGRWDFFMANPTCCMMNSAFLIVNAPIFDEVKSQCFVGLWVLVLIKPSQTSIFCSLFEWSITIFSLRAEVHVCGSPICRRWPLSAASKFHWAAKGCTRDVPGSSEPMQVGASWETAWCAKDGKMNRFGINIGEEKPTKNLPPAISGYHVKTWAFANFCGAGARLCAGCFCQLELQSATVSWPSVLAVSKQPV